MSYKTGGTKTVWRECYGPYSCEHTIYCALESVSDINSFKMYNENGKEEDIIIGAQEDGECGQYSLIDCLYFLSHKPSGTYECGTYGSIVIEDMTKEEVHRIFN